MGAQLLNFWLNLLPITHDFEEAQGQYEFLSELVCSPNTLQALCGSDPNATIAQLAKIYGEAFDAKYWDYEGVKDEDVPKFKN